MNRVIIFCLSLFILGCGNDETREAPDSCKAQLELIKKMEQDFVDSNFDKSLLQGLMVSYAEFSNSCPTVLYYLKCLVQMELYPI